MAKQIGLIASGCQVWNKNILDSGGDQFIYCSSLATYTRDLQDFKLLTIASAHEKTITGLTWCRSDPNFYATCGVDNKILKWSTSQETEIRSFATETKPIMVDWCSQSDSVIAVLMKPGDVYLWDTTATDDEFQKVETLPTGLTCIRWNPAGSATPVLAAGHHTGVVYLWNKELNTVAKVHPDEFAQGSVVTDLQWDSCSSCLLVTYSNGFLALVNTEAKVVERSYKDGRSCPVMSAFLPTMPGCFATVDDKASTLTIWSVAQCEPIERRGLGRDCGLVALKLSCDPEKLLLAFADGCVATYSVSQSKIVHCSQPGHSETVYDCRFKPSSADVLATASYDGSVKLWDMQSLACTADLKGSGQEGMLYSVSWCPQGEDDNRLVTASSAGYVYMWNTKRAVLLNRFCHHSKSVFFASWHPTDSNLIASASADKTCVVFDAAGKVLHKFTHPDTVYGCDWHPTNPCLLATACHDGIVRVFDISQALPRPIVELKGHNARAFHVAWSPLLPNTLASSSDDNTVRVWEVGQTQEDSKVLHVLEGHTNNVRAVLWNTEAPYLLLSGSWDGTLILWDIRSRYSKIVLTVFDHSADVYGLACHPERPFSLVSSSRDSSVRVWDLAGTLFAGIQMQVIINGGQVDTENMMSVTKNMVPETPVKLCGRFGKSLAKKFIGLKEQERQIFASFFHFISANPGMTELWALVEALETEGPSSIPAPTNGLVHINDLRSLYRAKAVQLKAKQFEIGGVTKKKRFQEAALIHLRLGNMKHYCEIMIEIGEWLPALAVAPAISMSYWQQLTRRYATELSSQQQSEAVPYLAATGQIDELLAFQNKQGDPLSSLLVAASDAVDAMPRPQDEEPEAAEEEESKRDEVFVNDRVQAMVRHLAQQAMDVDSNPVVAACYHLAVGDTSKAIDELYYGNEIVLAMAVCRVLKEDVDFVTLAMSKRCELAGLWHEALACIQNLPDPSKELLLLAARFQGSTHEKVDFYSKAGLPNLEGLAEQAKEQGSTADAVRSLVGARLFAKATDLGLELIRDAFAKADKAPPNMDDLKDIVSSLNSVDALVLDESQRTELLCTSYYFGLLEAIERGFAPVVPFLARAIRSLVARHELTFSVHVAQIKVLEAGFLQASQPKEALALAVAVAGDADKTIPAKTKAAAVELQKKLSEEGDKTAKSAKPTEVTTETADPAAAPPRLLQTAFSTLPSGDPRKFTRVSVLTGQAVRTGQHVLLSDKSTLMTESEYWMWVHCTPFSPLHTGGPALVWDPFARRE